MRRAEHAVLLVLFFLFIRNNVNADFSQENTSQLLSKLRGKRTPFVVVINNYSISKNLRSSGDQNEVEVSGEGAVSLNDVLDTKNAFHYMSDILRSTGDENDVNVKNTNEKYEKALRSRCEKFLECQLKCKKPKKKNNCKTKCQKVFDHLMMCNPPPPARFQKKSNREVYEYHKKRNNKNECDSGSDECKSKSKSKECEPSDECKSKSNECEPSDECKSKSNECEPSDECGTTTTKDPCESSDSCN